MNYFLDLCNLLAPYLDLFLTHLMLFISYAALISVLAWKARGFWVKNKVNADLIDERNSLDGELRRKQAKNRELERENKRLMVENQKLKDFNEELGQRVRELNLERLNFCREKEQMEEKIKNLETQKTLAEGKLRVLMRMLTEFLQTHQ